MFFLGLFIPSEPAVPWMVPTQRGHVFLTQSTSPHANILRKQPQPHPEIMPCQLSWCPPIQWNGPCSDPAPGKSGSVGWPSLCWWSVPGTQDFPWGQLQACSSCLGVLLLLGHPLPSLVRESRLSFRPSVQACCCFWLLASRVPRGGLTKQKQSP